MGNLFSAAPTGGPRVGAVLLDSKDPCPELAFLVAQNLLAGQHADEAGVVVLGPPHCPDDLARAAREHGVRFFGHWLKPDKSAPGTPGFDAWVHSHVGLVVSCSPEADARLAQAGLLRGDVRIIHPQGQPRDAAKLPAGVVLEPVGVTAQSGALVCTVPLFDQCRALPGPSGCPRTDPAPFAATHARMNQPIEAMRLRRCWERWVAAGPGRVQCFSGLCPVTLGNNGTAISARPLNVAFVGRPPRSEGQRKELQQVLGQFFVEAGCQAGGSNAQALCLVVLPNDQVHCGPGAMPATEWMKGLTMPPTLTVVAAQVPLGHTRSLLRAACPQVLFCGVEPTDLCVLHAIAEQCDIHWHGAGGPPSAFVDEAALALASTSTGAKRAAAAAQLYFESRRALSPRFDKLDQDPGLARKEWTARQGGAPKRRWSAV